MAEVQIYGFPPSTYTRTALLVLEEKGVDYEIVPLAFGSDELRAVNPFGKIPSWRMAILQSMRPSRYAATWMRHSMDQRHQQLL